LPISDEETADVCEWGGCDNTPEVRVYFNDPFSKHDYCTDCMVHIRHEFEYQRTEHL